MYSRSRLLLAISLVAMFLLLSSGLALSQSIPFETIDQGGISYFRYDDPKFLGADMIIRDAKTWEWFWQQHAQGLARPFPAVNFRMDIVLVTMLGFQTSGGPSIEISSIEEVWGTNSADAATSAAAAIPRGIRVMVKDNRKPGALTVITNPFHIIKVSNIIPHPFPIFRPRRSYLSVVFEHEPMEQITSCTDNSACAGNEFCAKKFGDCDGAGVCRPKPEVCIQWYNPVCGCDGKTYGNSCEAAAAGVSVRRHGRCEEISKCMTNVDCGLGEFCLFPDGQCTGPGVCTPKPRMCPLTFACLPIFCGCDGVTYCDRCEASLSGASILHDGACVEILK